MRKRGLTPRWQSMGRRETLSVLLAVTAWFVTLGAGTVRAQEEPPPPPKRGGMRITFLPPPMEGALSLGIYDARGKLVRVLAREATSKDFTIGLNGLITFWDGKDDAGAVMPTGLYYARGYSVGVIDVEGVAMHGNDWIGEDDSPRPTRVLNLQAHDDDQVSVVLRGRHGNQIVRNLRFDTQPKSAAQGGAVELLDGKLKISTGDGVREIALENGEKALDAALGANDRVWAIVQTASGAEVRAYTLAGEFLRRLGYAPGEPLPTRLVAARGTFAQRWSEQIMLLEQNESQQRVRTLALPLKPREGDAAAWETVMEKTIWLGETFDAVKDQLGRSGKKAFTLDKEFIVRLIDNPLMKMEPVSARVTAGFNEHGSYLQTADGLPLRRITETAGLKWIVIGHEGSGKLLTIFQSDGAVVEEFRAKRLAAMMAFDAGEYEWTGK